MVADACIHVANLFYVASYLSRDILWLRLWTCCGLTFGIVFFCTQSQAMFAPATWMGVFLAVNVVQIGRVVNERKHMKLTPRQERVGARMLEHLSREELLNILTKSMCENRTEVALIEHADRIELDADQRIVRTMAFDHLSNAELVNLIVRRFWQSTERHRIRRFFGSFARREGKLFGSYSSERSARQV